MWWETDRWEIKAAAGGSQEERERSGGEIIGKGGMGRERG